MSSPKTEKMASRIKELMAEGLELDAAINKAVEETATKGSRVQMTPEARQAYLGEMTNLPNLKKAIKVAFAKKSKAGENVELVSRYKEEIKAGQDRLNVIIADINNSSDPIAKAIEYGDEPTGIIQLILAMSEKGLDDQMSEAQKLLDVSNKELKLLTNKASSGIPNVIGEKLIKLGESYLKEYELRLSRNDQRVISLNRRLNFLSNDLPKLLEATIKTSVEAPKTEESPAPTTSPSKKEDKKNRK